jgi:hypothetical protein
MGALFLSVQGSVKNNTDDGMEDLTSQCVVFPSSVWFKFKARVCVCMCVVTYIRMLRGCDRVLVEEHRFWN